MNEDWEVIDTKHGVEGDNDWYSGTAISGRGVYNKRFGIVFDADRRGQSYYFWGDIYPEDGNSISMNIYCWDNTFYKIIETSYTHDHVASPAMGMLAPWPGTLNTMLDAYYQASEVDPSWPDTRVLCFYPDNRDDVQPWTHIANSPGYMYPWLINEPRDYPLINIWRWQSNFWFCCSPLTMTWWEAPYQSGEDSAWLPNYDRNYAVYQGPDHWITLNNDPGIGQDTEPLQLENSM